MYKKDFPLFKEKQNKSLIYFDTAATSQKPNVVIETMRRFLTAKNAPVHRSLYPLGEEATDHFERVRARAAQFLKARDPREIIFVRNATEGLNIVACSWGRANLRRGDEILVSRMEHHANFVPWIMLAKEKRARLRIAEINRNGQLDWNDFRKKLTRRTKIVALTHVSNVLGTINPISRAVHKVRNSPAARAIFVVDAAQSAAHCPINVQKLGCDFLAFSGHKLYGPTGIGVLWGRRKLLEDMPPFMTGGHMIREVGEKKVAWNDVPWRFEAGTPDAAGVIGLEAAIGYIERIGWRRLLKYEERLMAYALKIFSQEPFNKSIKIYGPDKAHARSGVIAFMVRGVHPHDVGSLLAEDNIAIRAGHHCAMPLHTFFGIPATARISFGLYNNEVDIDRFFASLKRRVLPFAK